ncbi:hypothetical protein BN7_3428 [Wickerhamomyces ciferrii]|uniref:Uncharacterized protein n=1 Tax=Wickerhamomyces ciferrii (strain ATCC 14091 / BCRC 22168 / CBS 111 / JCM 3599 / NBRC 0793 / NRRL Y-1031 F-60-10) TaxID=1206466 RepID=K0KRG3_WICCF|nr:uncharacterized protein BN7_3428 [Wickerhamomyces ciferrii]CCH43874.1 hypothetical protein BN7_3428 [Wickerhamomyces ciferrii]
MLLNKFPLHLQLNTGLRDEDTIMRDALHTPIGTPNGVSTPTEQVNFNNLQWFEQGPPNPPRYGRTGSTSSIASSVSNFSMNNNQNEFSYSNFASNYKLTEIFEKLLMDTYMNYQMNPTITPFNESNPPYGVVNKVSKDALNAAMNENIEIGIEINNYSLTIIRQKLLQLCHKDIVHTPSTSRQNSFQGGLNLQSKFNNIPSGLNTPNNIQPQQQGQMTEYFNFEHPSVQQQLNQPPPAFGGLQPSFEATPLANPYPRPTTPQCQQFSGPPPQARLERSDSNASNSNMYPDLFNVTSNRKRESLRLKRTGNQITYN